jgi:hypothetical protein
MKENVENIKAKLESAKEELKKRYGEAVEKIRQELDEEEDTAKDAWDSLKARF